MFRRLIFPRELTDQEARRLALPVVLAILILCGLIILNGAFQFWRGEAGSLLIWLGIGGMFYTLSLYYLIVPYPKRLLFLKWPVTLSNAILISLIIFKTTDRGIVTLQLILILVATVTIILWDRAATYTFLGLSLTLHSILETWNGQAWFLVLQDISYFLLGAVVIETIQRLGESNLNRLARLQAINDFARQVSSSLNTEEVLTLIGEALIQAIRTDTYFFGLVEAGKIQIPMLYDEGQYFHPTATSIEGTLSGWVVRNRRSLFIPDLRNDIDLEGVRLVLLGKGKTNLCWMGVPMQAQNVDGVMVVASYTPNDFNRTDLELLENLAQHAALAIANTYRHAEVEAQSRLDSLTRVYNHQHIVNVLNTEAERNLANKTPLSLIMLDIDHFKQYNDNYGHLLGDRVLMILTQTIRQHIKSTDSVGRWGGEEFTIVLPNTSGPQAQIVADRVRETVNTLSLQDRDGTPLPFPTVSQGLAVFPDEVSEVNKLLDLADQRLYIAKERGRNQIEPKPDHWKYLKQ